MPPHLFVPTFLAFALLTALQLLPVAGTVLHAAKGPMAAAQRVLIGSLFGRFVRAFPRCLRWVVNNYELRSRFFAFGLRVLGLWVDCLASLLWGVEHETGLMVRQWEQEFVEQRDAVFSAFLDLLELLFASAEGGN